ncbi:MAG: hypothetical protein II480_07305, partial [Bacteroidales bacterium]|nr:hypothetical protein [Bacteroidales bacterium]
MNTLYNIRRNAMWMAALLPLALQSCGGSGTSGGNATSQSNTAAQQQPVKQHFEIKILNDNPES